MKTQTAYNIVEIANVAVEKKLDFKVGVVEFIYCESVNSYSATICDANVHTMLDFEADALKFEVFEYDKEEAWIRVRGSEMLWILSGNISIEDD